MAEDLLGAQDLIFLEENHFSFVKSWDHFASGKTFPSVFLYSGFKSDLYEAVVAD